MSIGLAVVCLPYLRWKHPEWERPIKVNLFWPAIYIIATIYITIVPMIASPVETGMGVIISAWVAQFVDRSPSKAMNLGSIPRWGHDPAVGWGDIMFE